MFLLSAIATIIIFGLLFIAFFGRKAFWNVLGFCALLIFILSEFGNSSPPDLPLTPPEQTPHVAQSANGIPQIADEVLQAPPNIVHSAPLPSPVTTDKHLSAQNLAACTLLAANTHQVPAAVLIGMMHVEGGHIGKESKPTANGDYGIGPMQISSRIIPQLAQNWNVDIDTAHKRLRDDGCANMDVAASILRKKIDAAGSLYVGIALYHSNTVEPDPAYADRVIKVMNESGLIKHDETAGLQKGTYSEP